MFKIPKQNVLLGVGDKSPHAIHQAELALQKRLKELGIVDAVSHTQERAPLHSPIPTHRTAPNANPNAIDPSPPEVPHSGDILSWLRKKNLPSGPRG